MSPVETNTITSTRETTLLSRAVLMQRTRGVVRPQTAPTGPVPATALSVATDWRGRGHSCARLAIACDAQFQGGAVAGFGVSVTDLMVTDHPYSTRLGPISCRPPV